MEKDPVMELEKILKIREIAINQFNTYNLKIIGLFLSLKMYSSRFTCFTDIKLKQYLKSLEVLSIIIRLTTQNLFKKNI